MTIFVAIATMLQLNKPNVEMTLAEPEPPSINLIVEKWAYAIGKHESGNFKHCPKTCEVSHNYWGRKTTSGEYATWPSEEEAWADQKAYLTRRYEQGYDTLEKLNKSYAEDSGWSAKVKANLK